MPLRYIRKRPLGKANRSSKAFETHAVISRTILARFATSVIISGATLLVPQAPQAQIASQDERFDCSSNPHAFISALIDKRLIDRQPSRVEANSVNAFRPASGAHLRAFGFPVYVVLGYKHDDSLFRRGDGKEIPSPLYGVVVRAPSESVRQRVKDATSDATVQPVVPLLLTAVVCGG